MANWLLLMPEDLVKLACALVIGALIGAEREYHEKTAGLRTIILISVGSALFTIFSFRIGGTNDPARIAAQIVTGVGFLGAGVILHQGRQVKGLTTASTVWLAAALGIGAGSGYLLFSTLAALLALFVLWALPALENQLEASRLTRIYQITCPIKQGKSAELAEQVRKCNLRLRSHSLAKHGDALIVTIKATGPLEDHDKLVKVLIIDPEVKEFDYS